MSYVSPIDVTYDTTLVEEPHFTSVYEKAKEAEDDYVLRVLCEIGVKVDKEELEKALRYDRNQYEAGYNDCFSAYSHAISLNDAEPVRFEQVCDEPTGRCRCPRCAHHIKQNPNINYCSHCGQKLDWRFEK